MILTNSFLMIFLEDFQFREEFLLITLEDTTLCLQKEKFSIVPIQISVTQNYIYLKLKNVILLVIYSNKLKINLFF